MKASNRLTSAYLDSHAGDAARMLELMPDKAVSGFLADIPPERAATVVIRLMMPYAVSCIQNMDEVDAALIIDHMKTAGAVRLLKAMDQSFAQRLLTHLSRDHYSRIQQLIVYPPDSAGRYMDPISFLLPDSVHVSDAKRRVEQSAGLVGCEIYVIDDDFRLAGVVELNTLMTKKPKTLIRDIMKRHSQVIPVRSGITTLPTYKAWKSFKTLPVVESDNTVVGVLRYKDMMEALSAGDTNPVSADTSEDVIAVAGLYWNALTDMLDTALSFRTGVRKRE